MIKVFVIHVKTFVQTLGNARDFLRKFILLQEFDIDIRKKRYYPCLNLLCISITSHDFGDDLKCSHTMICFTYSVYLFSKASK